MTNVVELKYHQNHKITGRVHTQVPVCKSPKCRLFSQHLWATSHKKSEETIAG